jgi:hypothetical protein
LDPINLAITIQRVSAEKVCLPYFYDYKGVYDFSTLFCRSEMTDFDRISKKLQRNWAARLPNSQHFDYIREEIAKRVAERLDVSSQSITCYL